MKYLILLTLILSGCGGHYTVDIDPKQPIRVEPIKVSHELTLDTAKLEYYYRLDCQTKFTTQEDINACVKERILDFVNAFDYLK